MCVGSEGDLACLCVFIMSVRVGQMEVMGSVMGLGLEMRDLKGVVYDSGESLLIFELNSQTSTPLSSVLLQTRGARPGLVALPETLYEHRRTVFSAHTQNRKLVD